MNRDKSVLICCSAALLTIGLLAGSSAAEQPRARTISDAAGAASLDVLPAEAPPAGAAATQATHGDQMSERGPRVSDELVMTNAGELRRLVSTGHVLSPQRGALTGVLCAWSDPDNPAFRDELSALLGGAPVDYFDPRIDTPTVELMLDYAAVFTWTNYAYHDPVLLGDRLADYVDLGGKAILGQWCYHVGATNWLGGRIRTADYCPVTVGAVSFSSASYAGDGFTCIHTALGAGAYESGYRDHISGVQVTGALDGTYDDGLPTHGYRADYRVFYSAGNTGGAYGAGEWAQVVANMVIACGATVPWVACCDDVTGMCHDNWTAADCFEIEGRWEYDTPCGELEPTCGQLPGACCWGDEPPHFFECEGDMPASDCLALGATTHWHPEDSCLDSSFICPGAPSYCDACYTNVTDDWIAEVRFNEINNVSGPAGGDCSYGDYRAQQAFVARGMVVPMTVGVGTSPPGQWTQCVSVWIDWNQDYVFDASERSDGDCGQEPGSEVWYTTFDVSVPVSALSGATAMRVIEKYDTWPADACDADTYGEIEDYTVTVGEGVGACCTGVECQIDVVEGDCTGDFLGHGSVCDPNDCNTNDVPDTCDIAAGTSLDCNENSIPDECEEDCNTNGIPDDCDIAAETSLDCNESNVPDECDIADGTSLDGNENGVPDECEEDCNSNGILDICDVDCSAGSCYLLPCGYSFDCQPDGIPDECQMEDNDCNGNQCPDDCDIADCDGSLWCLDCQDNGIPDGCEVHPDTGQSEDCQPDGIPDECQLGEIIGDVRDDSCTAPDATWTVYLLTDDYPGETTWTLVERGFGHVATGGPYADPGTLHSTDVPICSDRCYDFTIFDSFGDGICCGHGVGYYEVYVDGVLIGSGGEFADFDSVLGIGTGCSPSGLPLLQPPNQSYGIFSDVGCEQCETGMQVVAENVNLIGADVIRSVRFWGGYYPPGTPQEPDAFTLIIREDANGLPGAAIATFGPMPATTKELTGLTLFDVSEWVYTIDFPPTNVGPGAVHFEIYNNTAGTPGQWFWETGNLDPIIGIAGEAYTFTLPEELWSYDDDVDMAWELHRAWSVSANDCNSNGIPDDCELICDFDGNDLVDAADYDVFLASFGHSSGDAEFEPCADFDDDSVVTLADYQNWLMCYRTAAGDHVIGILPAEEASRGLTGGSGAVGSIEEVRR